MKYKTFLQMIKKRDQQRYALYARKSHDYATSDVLSNFKRIGKVIKILRIHELPGPIAYSFTMVILKLDRWINLIVNNKTPQNESINDTIIDLHNYIDLTDGVIQDYTNEKKDKKV